MGSITTAALINGLAISGTTGNDVVENTGVVIGNVKLSGGTNKFSNMLDSSLFNMGKIVDLGPAVNQLYNNGDIELGDTGKIETVSTTELGGSFVQTSTANIKADFDFVSGDTKTGKIDRINATGSALLEGTFDLFVVNPNAAAPGSHEVTFFTTQQNMTGQSLILNAPVSAVADYDILYPSLNEAKFEYVIDFSPTGLNDNHVSFGDYINNVQLAGGSPFFADLVGTLFTIETLGELQKAYNSLSPEPYTNNLTTTVQSVGEFSDAMMSCRNKDGDLKYLAERDCAWSQVSKSEHDYTNGTSNFSYNVQNYRIATGAQTKIAENFYLGAAIALDKTEVDSGLSSSSEGMRPQAGIVLKYSEGETKIAGSLISGVSSFDTTRVVNVGNVGGVTFATQNVGFVAANARVSHLIDFGDTYLLPSMEGSATFMHQNALTETGGNLTNLSVDQRSQVYWSISQHLEFGGEIDLGSSVLRAKANIGVTQHLGGRPSVSATLVGTPAGVPSFLTESGRDNTLLTIGAGLNWIADNDFNLRIDANAQFGDHTRNKQITMKMALPF